MEALERIKKNLNILLVQLVALGLIGLTACQEEEGVAPDISQDEASVEITEDDQDANDYMGEVESDLAIIDLAQVSPGGKLGETDTIPPDSAFTCATITHDREAKVITIDFGENGCVGLDGLLKKGKIIITYTSHYLLPGAFITKTWEKFSINGNQIEGLRTIENTSVDLFDNPTFDVKLIGGKITFVDGTIHTRDADWELEWVNGANPLTDELYIDGSATGVGRRGVEYTVTITETLVRKKICTLEGVFIPVQGVKFIERKDLPNLTVDYGDGECDNRVTIIGEDGATREIDNFRRFRDRKRG